MHAGRQGGEVHGLALQGRAPLRVWVEAEVRVVGGVVQGGGEGGLRGAQQGGGGGSGGGASGVVRGVLGPVACEGLLLGQQRQPEILKGAAAGRKGQTAARARGLSVAMDDVQRPAHTGQCA